MISVFRKVLPTAQARPEEVTATPERLFDGSGFGLRTLDQECPFQCTISVGPPRGPSVPTAQRSSADTAATLASPKLGVCGLGTCFQDLPFQCRIRFSPELFLYVSPTAQMLFAEVPAMPASTELPSGFGQRTCFQDLPFQCTMTSSGPLLRYHVPTVQTSVAEMAATPDGL